MKRPKLNLTILSPRRCSPTKEDASPAEAGCTATVSVSETGTLKVFGRSHRYNFNAAGLVRRATDPAARAAGKAPTPTGEQAYKISEKDVRVLRKLGKGASSVVYKAYHEQSSSFVAVKTINCFEKEKRHQMMNDVKALCDVSHPTLVKFFGAYHNPQSGQIAIVLEYVDGGSLGDVLQKVARIPEDVLAAIAGQVLQGLAFLHRQKHTVHRDIKPANILVGLGGQAKIADFGISAFVDNTLAVCHTFTGTVTYMSPERINSQPYSFPSDIWSLGLSLLECFSGRYPYDASCGPLQLMMQVVEDPVPLPPPGACSDPLRDFLGLCMRKDPAQRPTAEALLQHPFILRARALPGGVDALKAPLLAPPQQQSRLVSLRDFMQVMASPADRREEATLAVTNRLFAALAGGRGGIDTLAGLFTPVSLLSWDGRGAKGAEGILRQLCNWADLHTACGGGPHEQLHVDSQPLPGGLALVHCAGTLQTGGAGPLASGPLGAGERASYSAALVLQGCEEGVEQARVASLLYRQF